MRFLASRLDRHFGSFKFRLAAYFLLLSLLPLMGAVWAFSEVATRGEIDRADARLNSALRIAHTEFRSRVDQATTTAESLARATGFQQAYAEGSDDALARLFREVPNAAFYKRGQLAAGTPPPALAIRRSATVVDPDGRRIGRVVAFVALDDELITQLHPPGFRPDALALVSGGRTVVGPAGLGRSRLPFRSAGDVNARGEPHRALAAVVSDGEPRAALVVLLPKDKINKQAASLQRKMLLLALIALAIAGTLAYVLGRAIVRSLKQLSDQAAAVARGNFSSRVPVRGRDEFAALGRAFNDMAEHLETHLEELAWERGRATHAVSRFGEALAATHNPYLLIPVIVDSMVAATGAAGGRLLVDGVEITSSGDAHGGGNPLEILLSADGGDAMLLLTPKETDFSDEARELAYWLASQARTALENATLHKRLEQAALMDTLTELPNRRQFEESLALELSRLERFGGVLALIVADLDDFKQVNDRYGHLSGDDVLRAFAEVLRANVREVDTAARYGGEEFAVLLPGTDLAGAESVAERIRSQMAERLVATVPGATLRVTASFGVAAYPSSPTEEALFSAADDALYRAKASGKNRVAVSGDARYATVRSSR
jgi:diguanylate cyclase (GGDEF)-like protein